MADDRVEQEEILKNVSGLDLFVEERYAGLRLDQYLSLNLANISRSLITTSIRKKNILVDGVSKKNSYRIKSGEQITGTVESDPEPVLLPEKIDFKVIYEDDWLLLLSKPPGLVVHPGSGNPSGTLVNGLLYYYKGIESVGESLRPGIVHRLDKDTSGLMVVAKRAGMHSSMVDLFKEHRLEKDYLALVYGVVQEDQGRIVTSIGRHPVQRQKMSVVEIGGKHAATNWQKIATLVGDGGHYSLLKVNIETGRTHQIRVHMAHMGFPVAGDEVYGRTRGKVRFPRQMLHSWRLSFLHPISGKKICGKAELWQDFREVLIDLGGADLMEKL